MVAPVISARAPKNSYSRVGRLFYFHRNATWFQCRVQDWIITLSSESQVNLNIRNNFNYHCYFALLNIWLCFILITAITLLLIRSCYGPVLEFISVLYLSSLYVPLVIMMMMCFSAEKGSPNMCDVLNPFWLPLRKMMMTCSILITNDEYDNVF